MCVALVQGVTLAAVMLRRAWKLCMCLPGARTAQVGLMTDYKNLKKEGGKQHEPTII